LRLNCHAVGRRLGPLGNAVSSIVSQQSPFDIWSACSLSIGSHPNPAPSLPQADRGCPGPTLPCGQAADALALLGMTHLRKLLGDRFSRQERALLFFSKKNENPSLLPQRGKEEMSRRDVS
jgi:hypothetical protein